MLEDLVQISKRTEKIIESQYRMRDIRSDIVFRSELLLIISINFGESDLVLPR